MIKLDPVKWGFNDSLSKLGLSVERRMTITIDAATGEPWERLAKVLA